MNDMHTEIGICITYSIDSSDSIRKLWILSLFAPPVFPYCFPQASVCSSDALTIPHKQGCIGPVVTTSRTQT